MFTGGAVRGWGKWAWGRNAETYVGGAARGGVCVGLGWQEEMQVGEIAREMGSGWCAETCAGGAARGGVNGFAVLQGNLRG